jgi:hypothetical protein
VNNNLNKNTAGTAQKLFYPSVLDPDSDPHSIVTWIWIWILIWNADPDTDDLERATRQILN